MNVPIETEEALRSNDEDLAARPAANTGSHSRAGRILVMTGLLAGAGVGAVQLRGYFDSYESTDDAQVEGHLDGIGSRISGIVTTVHFENNQKIAAGEVLVSSIRAVFKSQVDQAELNLSYTTIVAPVAGIAGKKSVEVGEQVRAGRQLLAISQTDEVWVTANFKETQLTRMHPGQTVRVSVDALDRKFDGVIESMPGATGAVYSVMPTENATGNYVKVVQRLPVRIRLNRDQAGLDLLHPGMPVEPVVRVQEPGVSEVNR